MFAPHGCSHGVRVQACASTKRLPTERPRLHQLHFQQVCTNCRSLRSPSFHTLDKSSGYGTAIVVSGSKPLGCLACDNVTGEVEEGNEGDAWLVDEVTTPFNRISVLELDGASNHELAGAYVLKLDGADLAHSIYWSNGNVWSGGCHDVFASLPPLLPEGGPVAILGLGAGTVARLLLHIWPTLHLEGWELDSEVIHVARQYFALKDLESPQAQYPNPNTTGLKRDPNPNTTSFKKSRDLNPNTTDLKKSRDSNPNTTGLAKSRNPNPNNTVLKKSRDPNPNPITTGLKKSRVKKSKGRLVVHVGDALGPEAIVAGGFAGIMVDIFINGTVCKELAEVSTWRKLKQRLRPGGRIMVNCIPNSSHLQEGSGMSRQWDELMYGIVRAIDVVFPGEVSVRELTDCNNVMLLSGEMPDAEIWSSKVPDRLVQGVFQWKRWDAFHAHWQESQLPNPKTLNPEPLSSMALFARSLQK